MQVLKFGGTSVANADNINKVLSVVQQASTRESTVVVVSALGGITDTLIAVANTAASGDEQYKTILQQVEQRHLDLVKALIPVTQQSSVLSLVKRQCNEIEDI